MCVLLCAPRVHGCLSYSPVVRPLRHQQRGYLKYLATTAWAPARQNGVQLQTTRTDRPTCTGSGRRALCL